MERSKFWSCFAVFTIVAGITGIYFTVRFNMGWAIIAGICFVLSGLMYFTSSTRKWRQPLLWLGLGLVWIYTGLGAKSRLHHIMGTLAGVFAVLNSIELAVRAAKGSHSATQENESVVSSGTDN